MSTKDTTGNMKKVSRSSVERDSMKVTNSSVEVANVKVNNSSLEIENMKVQTSSTTQGVPVAVNKVHNPNPSDTTEQPNIANDGKTDSNNGLVVVNTAVLPITDSFDSIKKITRKKETWTIGVIIDDIWTAYKGTKEDHVNMCLRDVKGDTIQATILESEVQNWIGKLHEGKTYEMRNFKVYENNTGYKYSYHKYRLTFVGATRVKEIELDGIPINLFKFKDFSEIEAGNYDPNLLVDAIGIVDSLKKHVTATTTKKANVSFTIKDLRANIMSCTLWDGLCEEFLSFYNDRTDEVAPVIVMKHARVKEPNGVFPVQLTNVWNGTKLLVDRNLPEIIAFQERLPKNVTYPTQQFSSSYSSQYQSQYSGGSQLNPDEKFIKQGCVISLGEMKKLSKDTYCVTVASTDHILVNNTGWYFRSCPECNTKADGNAPPYVCKNKHKSDDPIIKYKLDVQVEDGTDFAKFVFWDNTLEELIGMNVTSLIASERQRGYGDPQEYPRVFDNLMERKWAFRVKWSPTWGGQASVLEIKDRQELIDKIQEQLPVAESAREEIEQIQEDVEIIATPPSQKFTQSDIEKFASLDDAMLSTPNLYAAASADTEMSASSHKTPAKRAIGKQANVDTTCVEGQFSSTRSGKVIKKEKL